MCTGDHTDETGLYVRGKYEIAVLTYEMFLNLMVRNAGSFTSVLLGDIDPGFRLYHRI